jgi:hypothetical protein
LFDCESFWGVIYYEKQVTQDRGKVKEGR